MADEIQFPRSGVWHVRSKKDPRWNRAGQYASLLGDPPFMIPTEAQEALKALHALLGESPPDDLQHIALPYPSPKLKKLFIFHVFAASEKQALFQSLTRDPGGLPEVSLNWQEGVLSLGKPGQPAAHRLHAQFVGNLNVDPPCWQWAWATGEEGASSPPTLRSALALSEYGRQHEIPELTYPEIPLGQADDRPWFNVDYLAMACAHLCDADFYVAMPVPNTSGLLMYWLVKDAGVLPKPASESRRFFEAIREAMPHWGIALRGSDGREVVRAYADQKGCRASEVDQSRLRIDTASGEHLFVEFDEPGEIIGIQLPPDPEPPGTPDEPEKASWLNRLFGGKDAKRGR